MKKIIILIIGLIFLNGCTIISFEKGLNYKKTYGYEYEYDKSSQSTTINNNGRSLSIKFRQNSCGEYGLFGPLIFSIIPLWENHDCKDAIIGVGSSETPPHILYQGKIYKPSKISYDNYYYTFPLDIKSISENAILVVEKDGEKFEIPFKYQHTFSIGLWPSK